MDVLGFKKAKRMVLECIDNGAINHEMRPDIDVKNLLFAEEVTIQEVREVILRARGNDYENGEHHKFPGVEVHKIKTNSQGRDWYIKWYFIDPDTWFISVHE